MSLCQIALSPPWAVTGRQSPAERAKDAQKVVNAVLSRLERGHHGRKHDDHPRRSSWSDSDESSLLRHGRRGRRARVEAFVREEPAIFGLDSPETITTSQVLLLTGFFLSLVTWAMAFWQTVLGGATGSQRVKLAQPNCTPGLGLSSILSTSAGREHSEY